MHTYVYIVTIKKMVEGAGISNCLLVEQNLLSLISTTYIVLMKLPPISLHIIFNHLKYPKYIFLGPKIEISSFLIFSLCFFKISYVYFRWLEAPLTIHVDV